MIALLGTMLRARRFQAVLLTLLASIAFGTAFAVPAFLAAVDRSVIANELAHAPKDDRLVDAATSVSDGTPEGGAPDSQFPTTAPGALQQPSLDVVYAQETDVLIVGKAIYRAPRLQFRQDMCGHVTMASGRCPVGSAEVIIDTTLARDDSLSVGDTISIAYAAINPGPPPAIEHDSDFAPLVVNIVGVYRPRDPTEAFWGDQPIFAADATRGTDAPIFTPTTTFNALAHASETQSADGILKPSALRPDQLGVLRSQIATAVRRGGANNVTVTSLIPNLLNRIDADRSSAREVVDILAAPLLGLGWLAVFLATANAMSNRREEVGVVLMRGLRFTRRWSFGAGEAVLAVLVAIPLGVVLAEVAVRLAVRFLLPGHAGYPPIGPGALPYVVITFAGCIVAIVAATRRTLASSATELLRGVPPRSARWRTAVVDVVVVILAAVSTDQMLSDSGRLAGIDLIAPALVIAGVAVVAARLITPLASVAGRYGLRRGGRGLGLGIGAMQIARRPGASRLFVLTVITAGLVTYAAAGANVAGDARASRAGLELGSASVASVAPVTHLQLLQAVRKADPGGKAAMAVAEVLQPEKQDPPILAVDSSRLAAVANWPAGTISAARAVGLLNPRTGPSMAFTGGTLSMEVTAKAFSGQTLTPSVAMLVEGSDGSTRQVYFNRPDPSKPIFTVNVGGSGCRTGCRIAGLDITQPDFPGGQMTVTMHQLHVVEPVPSIITAFMSPTAWRGVPNATSDRAPTVASVGGNLAATADQNTNSFDLQLEPADSSDPAPALATAQFGDQDEGSIGFASAKVSMHDAAVLPALPGLGPDGIMVDLQNLDRVVPTNGDDAVHPQVWLAADAPANILTRLKSAGLEVLGVQRAAPIEAVYDGQGPAVGADFGLLAMIGIGLMTIGVSILTAAVDRARRGVELRTLRVQGVSAGSVRSAVRFAQLGLTVLGLIVGLAAGLISWRLTGTKIPIFADGQRPLGISMWPAVSSVAWPWAIAAALLLGVSSAAAWDLRRYVRRNSLGSGR
jgi:putative ABC transport system permease protein